MSERIARQAEAWKQGILAKALARFPEAQQELVTGSDRPVEPLYLPVDRSDEDYLARLGFPGQYPLTRGVRPTMYRGRRGPCASTRDSETPRNPTGATSTCRSRGRPGCP